MRTTQILIEKDPLVTSETFNMDNIHTQVYGEVPELVKMVISAMEHHPKLEHLLSCVLLTYHVKHKTLDEYVRYLRIGAAVYDGINFFGDNPDKEPG